MSSASPVPSFTRMEMTGAPGEVDRLMEVLSGCAEIRFDSRSEPDDRGEVICTVAVVSVPGQEAAPSAPVAATVTVQTVFELDQTVWEDLSCVEISQRVEQDAASLLSAVPGSSEVEARVVSVRPARAAQA